MVVAIRLHFTSSWRKIAHHPLFGCLLSLYLSLSRDRDINSSASLSQVYCFYLVYAITCVWHVYILIFYFSSLSTRLSFLFMFGALRFAPTFFRFVSFPFFCNFFVRLNFGLMRSRKFKWSNGLKCSSDKLILYAQTDKILWSSSKWDQNSYFHYQ